jgi:DNA polymerase-3 subunit delta'
MPFKEIRGQAHAVDYLKRSVAAGHVAHALLFSGPEGVGKRMAALALAQALNCLQAVEGDACGVCTSCRKVLAGLHPDIRLLLPDGQSLKIDQVRETLQHDAQLKPLEGQAKVYILDPADALTLEAANSLLKLLEEPPAGVVIVLITGRPYSLLDTIRSRCQEIRFAPLAPGVLAEWVQSRLDCAPEQARMLAMLSEGRPAEALRMADPELQGVRNNVLDLLLRARPDAWPETARQLMEMHEDLPETLTFLLTWFRDLAVLAGGGGRERVVNQDRMADLEKVLAQKKEGSEILLARCQKLLNAFSQLKRNVNPQLLSEVLLMDLV